MKSKLNPVIAIIIIVGALVVVSFSVLHKSNGPSGTVSGSVDQSAKASKADK